MSIGDGFMFWLGFLALLGFAALAFIVIKGLLLINELRK